MVYDCLIFFNEIDLLKIRIEELKDVVDYFVVVESNKTHKGMDKPLYFEKYKNEFSQYKEKIIYHVVEDLPKYISPYRNLLEYHQRNQIYKALENNQCQPEDIILLSDCDEIPNQHSVSKLQSLLSKKNEVIFVQKIIEYYLNEIKSDYNNENNLWCGTIATKFHLLSNKTIEEVRRGGVEEKPRAGHRYNNKSSSYEYLLDGGWHLCNLGGFDSYLYKLQNYSHPEIYKNLRLEFDLINENICRSNLHNNINFMRSYGHIIKRLPEAQHKFYKMSEKSNFIPPEIPIYVKNNVSKFSHLFKYGPYETSHYEFQLTRVSKIKSYFIFIKNLINLYFRRKKLISKNPKRYDFIKKYESVELNVNKDGDLNIVVIKPQNLNLLLNLLHNKIHTGSVLLYEDNYERSRFIENKLSDLGVRFKKIEKMTDLDRKKVDILYIDSPQNEFKFVKSASNIVERDSPLIYIHSYPLWSDSPYQSIKSFPYLDFYFKRLGYKTRILFEEPVCFLAEKN